MLNTCEVIENKNEEVCKLLILLMCNAGVTLSHFCTILVQVLHTVTLLLHHSIYYLTTYKYNWMWVPLHVFNGGWGGKSGFWAKKRRSFEARVARNGNLMQHDY